MNTTAEWGGPQPPVGGQIILEQTCQVLFQNFTPFSFWLPLWKKKKCSQNRIINAGHLCKLNPYCQWRNSEVSTINGKITTQSPGMWNLSWTPNLYVLLGHQTCSLDSGSVVKLITVVQTNTYWVSAVKGTMLHLILNAIPFFQPHCKTLSQLDHEKTKAGRDPKESLKVFPRLSFPKSFWNFSLPSLCIQSSEYMWAICLYLLLADWTVWAPDCEKEHLVFFTSNSQKNMMDSQNNYMNS